MYQDPNLVNVQDVIKNLFQNQKKEVINHTIVRGEHENNTSKSKRTGQVYADKNAFNADVADPNTETTEDDFRQDLEITVASLEVFGKND